MNSIQSFTTLRVDPAQGARNSICQVGLVWVEAGIVIDAIELLVQPSDNFYLDRFIDIHGSSSAATATAPTCDKVWNKAEPINKNQNVIVHVGFAYDFPVLNKTLEHYQIEVPDYTGRCTYKMCREALDSHCEKYRIDLDHHNSLSDALACAKLFMSYQ